MTNDGADSRDAARVRRALEGWAPGRLSESGPIEVISLCRAEGGQSSETWLVDARVDGARDLQRWVLRVQPTARQVYEDPSVARQFHVIRALSAQSGLPVPAAIALEEDADVLGAPFFLMTRATGVAPPNAYHSQGMLFDAAPAERSALWAEAVTLLGRLHKEAAQADFGFLAFPGAEGGDGAAQELARWDSFRGWSGIEILPLYDDARRWLDDRRPAHTTASFAWGDARPSNMLFEGGTVSALLDWETASLGGPESDLGWWLAYDRMVSDIVGVPRLAGVPGASETLALWEAASGRTMRDIEWHLVFATYRFALISERAMLLAQRAGRLPKGMAGRANPAVRLLRVLLEEAG